MIKTRYMNLYHSGYFHRIGKPDTLDIHGGDLYETYDAAEKHISPRSHYICTTVVTYNEPEDVQVNNSDSHPRPLAETRPKTVHALMDDYATVSIEEDD